MPDSQDGLLAVEEGGALGSSWVLSGPFAQCDLPAQALLFNAMLALHHHHRAPRIWPRHTCTQEKSVISLATQG